MTRRSSPLSPWCAADIMHLVKSELFAASVATFFLYGNVFVVVRKLCRLVLPHIFEMIGQHMVRWSLSAEELGWYNRGVQTDRKRTSHQHSFIFSFLKYSLAAICRPFDKAIPEQGSLLFQAAGRSLPALHRSFSKNVKMPQWGLNIRERDHGFDFNNFSTLSPAIKFPKASSNPEPAESSLFLRYRLSQFSPFISAGR